MARSLRSVMQQVAFNALLFVFRHVLTIEIVGLDRAVRALKPCRLTVVPSRHEMLRIFD